MRGGGSAQLGVLVGDVAFEGGLGSARLDRTMLAVSVVGSILAHALLLLGLLLARLLGLSLPPSAMMQADSEPPNPVGIVPARLVRLGEPPEKSRMPDRIVPAVPTAPNDGTPVSTVMDPPEPEKQEKRRRPLNPLEDDNVRDVLARLRTNFGERTDHVPRTGHPSGVEGGDVADPALAQKGSLWARQIHEVLKAYITYPTIITEEELDGLRCKVEVEVGPDLVPREAKLAERGWSGNRFFDQAVLDSFETMRVKRVKLPPPPGELEARLFRAGLVLNIYGRDLD